MRREVNVLALVKGSERYVYLFDEDSHASLLDVFAEHAFDPSLSLNGFDAAVLSQRSHEQMQEAEETRLGSGELET